MRQPLDLIPSDDRLPAAADVVVVGGGIAGVAAAYWLAKRRIPVAVVEKGVIAGEQSSRNWGWCRQQGRDRVEVPLIRHAVEMWAGMAAEIGADVGFRRCGVLYATDSPKELAEWEGWAAFAREHQVVSHLLTADEVSALLPGCRQRFLGGLRTPSDGRAEPATAAPAIAAAARGLGASIHQNCAARGIETEAGAVAAVVTEKGRIRTRAVLCAAGAWSAMFCRRHGIRLPQLSVRASVLQTAPAAGTAEPNVATPGVCFRRNRDGGYVVAMSGTGTYPIVPDTFRYLRDFWPTFLARRAKLRLSVGRPFLDALRAPRVWPLDRPSPFEAVRVLDPAPDERLVVRLLAEFKATFPALGEVRALRSWGGMIESVPDAVPVIDAVEPLPGLWLATGFSGHGFGIGPGAGRLAADLITGSPPLVDPTPFRYRRMIDGTRLAPQAGI